MSLKPPAILIGSILTLILFAILPDCAALPQNAHQLPQTTNRAQVIEPINLSDAKSTNGSIFRSIRDRKEVSSLHDQGEALQQGGKFVEAEALFRKALDLHRTLGEDDADVPDLLNHLAGVLEEQHKLAEAELFAREEYAVELKLTGPAKPELLKPLSHLAMLLHEQGKVAESEPYLREAVAIRRKISGDEEPALSELLLMLADVLVHEFRQEGSDKPSGNAGELIWHPGEGWVYGGDTNRTSWHRNSASQQLDVAQKALEKRDYELAVKAARRITTAWPTSDLIVPAAKILQRSYENIKDSKLAEAEATVREALAIAQKNNPEDNDAIAEGLDLLGSILTQQGKLIESETVLRRALALNRKSAGSPDQLVENLEHLSCVLRQEGKKSEADSFDKESKTLRKPAPKPASTKVPATPIPK